MPSVVVIEQPNYLPWIGYFSLVAQCDVWVWYDDVQYTRRDWRNRNRVDSGSDVCWLTVPVRKAPVDQRICDVEIDYSRPWVDRHLATLHHGYRRAPYFAELHDLVAASLQRRHVGLAGLTIELGEAICGYLGLQRGFRRSADFGGLQGRREERLLDLCRRLGATTYLSGPAARNYITPRSFLDQGLALRYAVYDFPPYPRGGRPFVPNLSILDPLFWLGPHETRDYLERHARSEPA
jgi:WbqC-like protein